MKTRTKLLTALLSTVTALSCALTAAADTTPTITLQGNESRPAATDADSVSLSLKATGFESVAGADLKITLNNKVSLNAAEVTVTAADGSAWTPSNTGNTQNYIVKGNTIKIVDVFTLGGTTVSSLDLTITLKFSGDVNIGRYDFSDSTVRLVDENENDISVEGAVTLGKLVIGKNEAKNQTSVVVPDGAFVPYGGVAFSDGTYADKNRDGSFVGVDDSNQATVASFILPDSDKKLTTFGASKSTKSGETNVIQFGSYVNTVNSGDSYGTVLIGGDFDDIVKYYQEKDSETYKTAEDVLKRFMELLDTKDAGKFYKITYRNKEKSVKVAKVPQTTYMWRDSEETMSLLQYAVRLSGVTDNSAEYTAVGYSYDNTNYEFSTEIKTATLGGLGN